MVLKKKHCKHYFRTLDEIELEQNQGRLVYIITSSHVTSLSPAGLMKTTPGGTVTFNEMRGGPRAVNISFTLAPSTWIIGKIMIIVLLGDLAGHEVVI